MHHYYEEGSAFYRVLESRQAGCAVVIGAIIRGRGLPTTLLPLVTPADEQPSKINVTWDLTAIQNQSLNTPFPVNGLTAQCM